MRVVIDARLARGSGHRTYLGNVIPRIARLAPDWRFTVLGDAAVAEAPFWTGVPNIDVDSFDAPLYGVREQLEPLIRWGGADLYWVPHYNVPVLRRGRTVVTVHDMAHLRLPEYTSNPARRAYARAMFGVLRAKADAIVFISEFTRVEFTSLVGAPRCLSEMVHQGVGEQWFDERGDEAPEPGRYFLFVGNLKPHKNLKVLFEAWPSVAGKTDARLIVIGREGLITADREMRDHAMALGSRVTLLDHCDDATLRRYVRHATALVFPSLYEGFGLPPLEAMAAGCPVIASRAASIPEVCGAAAIYFDPRSAGELANRMLDVAALGPDRRADVVARGLTHARQFTWDQTAAKTLAILRHAAR